MVSQDLTFSIVFMISCFIQYTLYADFLNRFLIPKYKYSFLYCSLTFAVCSFFLQSYFFVNAVLKTYLSFMISFIVPFLFYKEKKWKMLSVAPIFFGIAALCESISIFMYVFIFQQTVFLNAPIDILIFMQFFTIFFFFFFFRVILYFFHHKIIVEAQFSFLYIILMIITFLIAIILSESFSINHIFSISSQKDNYIFAYNITLIVSFAITFLLIIIIYRHIKRLKKNIAEEMKIQTLSKQYIDQLNEYMENQNDEDEIRYLRHDIMNYLQNVADSKKEEEHETD